LVTNNEVSEDTRSQLLTSKVQEGDDQWEDQGICRAVAWPRCKTAVTGKRGDGKPLAAWYSTGEMEETEIEPSIVQLGFAEGTELTLSQRKDIVRLIDGLALGAVSLEEPWQIEKDARVSILWDIRAADKWIEALVEAGGGHKAYVVSKDKKTFRALSEELKESLPPLMRLTEKRRPIDLGFEENVAYFRLGFLEPGDVARGQQFQAILPLLWMLAGSRGRCPISAKIARWLIAPECGLAVLHKEEFFDTFLDELDPLIPSINHVFLVTDSEDAFKEMRQSLPRAMVVTMLYSSYLRNFAINAGPTP
jgi:adenine-specific DNA-methyltransferase